VRSPFQRTKPVRVPDVNADGASESATHPTFSFPHQTAHPSGVGALLRPLRGPDVIVTGRGEPEKFMGHLYENASTNVGARLRSGEAASSALPRKDPKGLCNGRQVHL
jgi:hypothetical protein